MGIVASFPPGPLSNGDYVGLDTRGLVSVFSHGQAGVLFLLGLPFTLALILMFVIGIFHDLEAHSLKIKAPAKGSSIEVVKFVSIKDVTEDAQFDLPLHDGFIVLGKQHNFARLIEWASQSSGQNVVFDSKGIRLIAVRWQHGQIHLRTARSHNGAVAFNYISLYSAAIHNLAFDVDRIVPNELVARFDDEGTHLDSWPIGENQRLVSDPHLLVDHVPLAPSKIRIEARDQEQQIVGDDRRLIPTVLFGGTILCGSFFLGAYSMKRVGECRFDPLKRGERNRWFRWSLVAVFGFWFGRFPYDFRALDLVTPRLRGARRLGVMPTLSGSMRTRCLSASWNVSGWSEMGFAFGIVLSFAGTAIGIVRPCPQSGDWPCLAEASASGLTSASCYHVKENVLVVAIVEAVLKLSQIQRQIFLAHVVIGAEDSALEQRPERFDAVRVDFAANIFVLTVLMTSCGIAHLRYR